LKEGLKVLQNLKKESERGLPEEGTELNAGANIKIGNGDSFGLVLKEPKHRKLP